MLERLCSCALAQIAIDPDSASLLLKVLEVSDRLDLLDQSFYDQDHREAVYLRREEDADEDSLLERFMQLYVSSGIKNWGQATHPANLDFWLQQEGGVARTCELLLALEVLNFYRWICRLSRLQVDSFLQELADVFLQVIQKRSDRPLCKATEDHLALAAAVEEFRDSEGLRMAILSHLPSAADAAREIFSGLPGAATSDGGPKLLQGRAEIKLPLKSQMSLEPYLPLFSLVGNARKASKSSRASFSSTEEKRAFGVRMEHVPNGPPASLPPPPGKSRSGEPFHSSGRRSHCWGDIRGVVTLRRTMLDPRVFSVGVMRRGCNFCIVCPADIFDGQPPEDIHEEPPPEDDFLDPDNTGKDAVQEQKTRAVMSKEFKQLLKWRENEPWKKLVKQKAKGPDANRNRMEEKLTSLDENVDLDDMEGWQVQRSTVVDDCPEEIAFARRTQDTQDAQTRTEHALRREGKLVETKSAKKRFDHFLQEEELEEPLMVCFPPPGFVPVEMLCEAELMPWTISPDPFRLSPRLDCKVQVFRVKIDHSASTAERLSEVPLLNFCVR
ncbi:unnamed protein product [Effrenium voratum]|nr:unnamed protein product [Effrenium voratum]